MLYVCDEDCFIHRCGWPIHWLHLAVAEESTVDLAWFDGRLYSLTSSGTISLWLLGEHRHVHYRFTKYPHFS
jgi:hypothetical protein